MPMNQTKQSPLNMVVRNAGNQVLSEISLRIAQITKDCFNRSDPNCTILTDLGPMHPQPIGNLAPRGETFIPGWIKPDSNADGTGAYIITIAAQNGLVTEQLWFRRAKIGDGWAYKFIVMRPMPNKGIDPTYNIFKNAKVLKMVDWIEPKPQ